MDKEEYRQKLDELTEYVKNKDFDSAVKLADEIDWRRVKSLNTLNMVADIYEVTKDYEREKEILQLALSRASIGHSILYRLVEVCLKLGEVDEAERYFNEFSRTSKNDNSRCILQYKLYKAKNAPLEAQIDVLEEYREREYTERWAYELALLYSKAGDKKKCVDACDDLILWFGEGKYVLKAMELKKKYEPLTPMQERAYEKMLKAYRKPQPNAADADDDDDSEEDANERAASYSEREKSTAAVPQEVNRQSAASAAAEKQPSAEEKAPVQQQAVPEETIRVAKSPEKTVQKTPVIPTGEQAPGKSAAKSVQEPSSWNVIKQQIEKKDKEAAGLKIKDLKKEDLSTRVKNTDVTPAKPQAKMKTEDFDLGAFLKETAGSFSDEIKQDDFTEEDTGLSEVVPEKKSASAETEAKSAVPSAVKASVPETPAPRASEAPAGTVQKESADRSAETVKAVPSSAGKEQTAASAGTAGAGNGEAPQNRQQEKNMAKREEHTGAPAAASPAKTKPHYNEELEVPDPEPTEAEKKAHTHTIPLDTIGENTVPISIDKILSEETPEERRIRILNKAKPTRMSEEQRRIFTYFARVPGMDGQILEAINGVYQHAGERTSLHGNIAIMGARGTGKSRLARGLVVAMCKDLGMDAAKVAHITGKALNERDPAKVVSMMAGGFLIVEDIADINEDTLDKLNQAMEFRTDCMVMIIEDEKTRMRSFLKEHPQFAGKFDKVISIPIFTNDELVTFARTYATENGCKIDDMAILALYTMIGNIQSEEEPTTISTVKKIIDNAILHATKGRRKKGRDDADKTGKWLILHEKDFTKN